MATATIRPTLDDIKQQYDLATVVERAIGQEVGRHNLRCPFHADNRPSLHVWDDGRWKCFGCGKRGDVLDFVGYLLFGDGYDPHTHLKDVLDSLGALDIQPLPAPVKPRVELRPTLDPALPDTLHARMGEREIAYWAARGIPKRTLIKFRVGWTGQRYAFPWLYRGVFTAMKLRRDDDLTPDLEPKYISLKGSRFTAPFNIDRAILGAAPDAVLIAEDEKSAMAADVYGLTAISCAAGAWKAEWVSLLSRVRNVVILADRDEVGQEAAYKIQSTMRRARIMTPDSGKDFFDFHQHLIGIPNTDALVREWLGL